MRKLKALLTIFSILTIVVGTIMSITLSSSALLSENILFENSISGKKTNSEVKTDAWFKQIPQIRKDAMANGTIHKNKGEYYLITLTGFVSEGTATLHLGENVSWEEYKGESGTLTTTPSTITLKVDVPVWGVEGEIYLCDSGLPGHTIEWSYIKVSVFRNKDATMLGDANSDDHLDMKDVLVIRKSMASMDVGAEFNASNADANGDNAINMKDVLALRKHLASIETLPTITTTTTKTSPGKDVDAQNKQPDQISIAFYDADATQYGFTWHNYVKDSTQVLQYMEKPSTGSNDFTNATVIEATCTEYATLSMDYDLDTNNFIYGYDIQDVTDYTYKAATPALKFDTTYIYRVGDPKENIWSNVGELTTRKENVQAFSFIEVSDTQVGAATDPTPFHYMHDALIGAFNADPNASFIVNGGDFVQCTKYLHLWRNQFNGNKDFLMNHVMMPVTGNHDAIYDTAGKYEVFKHFNIQLPEENNVPEYGIFYSYNYGNAHFVVLNTDCFKSSGGALDEAQLAWLQKDLAANDKEWTIVIMHRPMFAIRQLDVAANRDQLLPILKENGVDLVIQSHEHVYMRSHPIDGDGTILKDSETKEENGISYYVNPDGILFVTCATGGSDGKAPMDAASKDFCHTYGDGHASSFGNFQIDGNKLTVSVRYYDNGVKEYENGTWGIIKN